MSDQGALRIRRRGVLAAMPLLAAFPAFAKTKEPASHPPPLYGRLRARKRFVMWGSYTCPYTAALVPILKTIVDENPERVSLEWHHFPTHPPDPALHVQGLAFEGKHFWGFTGAVLGSVYAAGGAYRQLTAEKLAEFARAEGASAASLRAAEADPAKWQVVKDDLLAGKLLGITITPGLFYDGFFLTPGGLPANVKGFENSLRDMIAKA